MKTKFKTNPICEDCGNEPASAFTHAGRGSKWKFTGDCTSKHDAYYIEFDRFFKSPATTVDWLAHMGQKGWMDWKDFMAMMTRFRKATNSFAAE